MATGTAGSSARDVKSPVKQALYTSVNYNDTGIASGVKFGTLPAGAVVTMTSVHVTTTFNAATTNVLTVGTNGTTANDLIASGSVDETTAGATNVAPAASTAWGPLSADTDVYVKYTQTGTAATQGVARIVVEYINYNDC